MMVPYGLGISLRRTLVSQRPSYLATVGGGVNYTFHQIQRAHVDLRVHLDRMLNTGWDPQAVVGRNRPDRTQCLDGHDAANGVD